MINYSIQFETNDDLLWFLNETNRASILRDIDSYLRNEIKYNSINYSDDKIDMMQEIRDRIYAFCKESNVTLNKN